MIADVGVMVFSWMTAATVITLLVDPGSYTSDSARLPRSWMGAAPGSDGSKLGAVARARIAPLRGSITTTVPLSASDALTSATSAFSAAHWMSRSMVSRIELPSTGSRWLDSELGISRPPAPAS